MAADSEHAKMAARLSKLAEDIAELRSRYRGEAARLTEIETLDQRHPNLEDQLRRLKGDDRGICATINAELERGADELGSMVESWIARTDSSNPAGPNATSSGRR